MNGKPLDLNFGKHFLFLIEKNKPTTLFGLIEIFFTVLHDQTKKTRFIDLFDTYQSDLVGKMTEEHKQFLESLYNEIHNTKFYQLVSEVLQNSDQIANKDKVHKELVTIIMLGIPPRLFVKLLPESLQQDYETLQSIDGNSMVGKEISAVRDTLLRISDYCLTCGLQNLNFAFNDYLGKKINPNTQQ